MSLQNTLSLFKSGGLGGLAFSCRCWSFGVFPLLCSFFSVFFQWIAEGCEVLSTASMALHTGSWQLTTSNFLSLSTCIICDGASSPPLGCTSRPTLLLSFFLDTESGFKLLGSNNLPFASQVAEALGMHTWV